MAFPDTYESIIKEENINNGGYVQMEWNDTDCAPIATGTVCPVSSDYIMFSTYYPSQSAVGSYRYNPKFLHRLAQLDYLPFYFKTKAVAGTDSSGKVTYEDVTLSTYPYTGNISTIANALAVCLSDHGDLGEWTADTSGLSDNIIQSVSFDGATIKSAAQAVADAFGVDYYFIWGSRTVKFGAYSTGNASPDYGQPQPGNGITEDGDSLVSATDGGVQYNTFRILGGTRNMSKKTVKGQNVQVTQRLMLDENGSIMGGGTPKIMKDLVFDDIYPKMELWMYDVHERRCWLTDENGKKIVDSQHTDEETGGTVTTYKQYSKWYFKLAYWNGETLTPYVFDSALQIKGLPLSLVFQPNYADGALPQPLVGREYELTYFDATNPPREKDDDDVDANGYQPSHGEYRIIFKVEGDKILPSTNEEGIRPYGDGMSLVNNKVTLVNVAMDEVYKKAAQAELRKAGRDAVAAYMRDKSSFTYLTYGAAPAIGGIAGSGGTVTSVRTDLITGEVQYTVGDYQSSKGLIGRLSDKIDTISTSGGSGTTQEESTGSGRGGGVSESSIPLLSKLMGSGNLVKDTLMILKELLLGTNGRGIFKDANGNWTLDIDNVDVRGSLAVNVLKVNQTEYLGGEVILTVGGSIEVTEVEETDGGGYKVYFKNSDSNGREIYCQMVAGDLAKHQTYNEKTGSRLYWLKVDEVGSDYVVLSRLEGDTTAYSTPRAGDEIVHLGNVSDKTRQAALIFSARTQSMRIYTGIDTTSLGNATAPIDLNPVESKILAKFITMSTGVSLDKAFTDIRDRMGVLVDDVDTLKNQSDKQFIIWFTDYTPTLTNKPYTDWIADGKDERELHIKDILYNTNSSLAAGGGRAFHFKKDPAGNYYWDEITDKDTLLALEKAAKAQDTADGKRRIFVDQPVPPYDPGDSWVNAIYNDGIVNYDNDMLVVKKGCGRDKDESFNINDWQPATKATTAYLAQLADQILAFATNTNNAISDIRGTIADVQGKLQTAQDTAAQAALDAARGIGLANVAQEAADSAMAALQVTDKNITALVDGGYLNADGTIRQTVQGILDVAQGYVTALAQNLTFDENGLVTNIDRSGLVLESTWAAMFTDTTDENGVVVARAQISTLIADGVSKAVIKADQIEIDGKTVINDYFFVDENGHLTIGDKNADASLSKAVTVYGDGEFTGTVNATGGVFSNVKSKNGTWMIDEEGNFKATSGEFKGKITATSGTFNNITSTGGYFQILEDGSFVGKKGTLDGVTVGTGDGQITISTGSNGNGRIASKGGRIEFGQKGFGLYGGDSMILPEYINMYGKSEYVGLGVTVNNYMIVQPYEFWMMGAGGTAGDQLFQVRHTGDYLKVVLEGLPKTKADADMGALYVYNNDQLRIRIN